MNTNSTLEQEKLNARLIGSNLLVILTLGFISFISPILVEAKRSSQPATAELSCMKATNYFIPEARDYSCAENSKVVIDVSPDKTAKICPAAKKAARLQGSIQVKVGRQTYLHRFNGKTEKIPKGCDTTTGAAGVCLIPYLHIAADPEFFAMGDVVEVPALKGKQVPHPSGSGMMKHPGYVIVADTGGDIKGDNRFDFFIGGMAWESPRNPLGPYGLKMTDDSKCILGFKRIKGDTPLALRMKTKIYALADSAPIRTIASQPLPVPLAGLGAQQ